MNEFTREVSAGLNYIDYDLSLDEKNLTKYQNALNDEGKNKPKDEGQKKIELKKADNGKYYLQKGKYTIVYDKDGATTSKELEIN